MLQSHFNKFTGIQYWYNINEYNFLNCIFSLEVLTISKLTNCQPLSSLLMTWVEFLLFFTSCVFPPQTWKIQRAIATRRRASPTKRGRASPRFSTWGSWILSATCTRKKRMLTLSGPTWATAELRMSAGRFFFIFYHKHYSQTIQYVYLKNLQQENKTHCTCK